MRAKQTAEIQAQSESEALARAAEALARPPSDLVVERRSDGKWFAHPPNLDGDFEFRVNDEATEVTLTLIAPAYGAGKPLTVADIVKGLTEEGVVFGVDEARIAKALDKVNRLTAELKNIPVASSRDPEPSVAARLRLYVADGQLVIAGEKLAEFLPEVRGQPGKTVLGKEIPSNEVEAHDFTIGAGVEFRPEENSYFATLFGRFRGDRYALAVESVIQVAEDHLSVTCDLAAFTGSGFDIKPDFIAEQLGRVGVVFGVDRPAIEAAIQKSVDDKNTVQPGVVVARAVEAIAGHDATLVLEIDSTVKAGKMTRDGRMDFRERDLILNVLEGQVLARKVPPTTGTPGRTVTGTEISAKPGKDREFRPGENVTVNDRGEFLAAIDGMVGVRGERLEVRQLVQIPKDVDFSTGNVAFDKGAIEVAGAVRTGFCVRAFSNVVVNGVVEAAEIISGGDVEFRQGMAGGGAGKVKSQGFLKSPYIESATLEVGGDLFVTDELFCCDTLVGGDVMVSGGKGIVIGGRLHAGGMVTANAVGTDTGGSTVIRVGRYLPEVERLEKAAEAIEKGVAQLKERRRLRQPPLVGADGVTRDLAYYQKLNEALKQKRSDLVQRGKSILPPVVRVIGKVESGTRVTIESVTMVVRDAVINVEFRLDAEVGVIRLRGL